jgi:endonuclease G
MLPRQFWKVVTMVKEDRSLSATGYLLSQEELIQGLELVPGTFSYAAYRTYQVRIGQIESLTHLSFGSLADADPLGKLETPIRSKEIARPEELVL